MASPDIMQIQSDLIAEFAVFDYWVDRYQYLIDLGRQLPPFPERWKIEANRVQGCQAQVWLHCRESGGQLVIQAISDAAIVSGLIALLIRVYSNQPPKEILDRPPIFIKELGLETHLSPTRSNGLHVMLNTIMQSAAGFIRGNIGSPHGRTCRGTNHEGALKTLSDATSPGSKLRNK